MRILLALSAVFALSACMPSEIVGSDPNGREIRIAFYPGGNALDDLMIIGGNNYFGQAQYQIDDPLGDIGFRLKNGPRVQAECSATRRNFMGENECTSYTVYRSDFDRIPTGSRFGRPAMY